MKNIGNIVSKVVLLSALALWSCQNSTVPMPESSKNGQAISKIVPAKITNVDTMMAQIRKAFEKRDPQLLAPLLADSICSGHPENGGPCVNGCPTAFFMATFFPDSTANEWKHYQSAIQFGFGGVEHRINGMAGYVAPSLPNQKNDQRVYIYATNVNIREQPDSHSKVLTRKSTCWLDVNYNKLEDDPDRYTAWIPVWYEKGKLGYVAEQFTNWSFDLGVIEVCRFPDGTLKIVRIDSDSVCAL
jgi:hypothetical protein